ncbi:MAG: hypothetical protein Q4A78_02290 [Peptostreptococcaceae bacterium]|nr:hypothetical protein [Peptostreptococcaceae bacterium]
MLKKILLNLFACMLILAVTASDSVINAETTLPDGDVQYMEKFETEASQHREFDFAAWKNIKTLLSEEDFGEAYNRLMAIHKDAEIAQVVLISNINTIHRVSESFGLTEEEEKELFLSTLESPGGVFMPPDWVLRKKGWYRSHPEIYSFEVTGGVLLEVEEYLLRRDNETQLDAWEYMKYLIRTGLMKEEKLIEIVRRYQEAYEGEKAYEELMFNMTMTHEGVKGHNFPDTTAVNWFVGDTESYLSPDSMKVIGSRGTSQKPPKALPSNGSTKSSPLNENQPFFWGGGDVSARDGRETEGVGYEAKSLDGYYGADAYFRVGNCNVETDKRAGYMFFTVYQGNYTQDVGIGYYENRWRVFTTGHLREFVPTPDNPDGWMEEDVSIKSGDLLYYKVWVKNGYLHFSISKWENIDNPFFKNQYKMHQGVNSSQPFTFNRQITLVDSVSKDETQNPKLPPDSNSGLHLMNAGHHQSSVYKKDGKKEYFNDNNVHPTDRGKFGCTWADKNRVRVLTNTHWDGEVIFIKMKNFWFF